MPLHAVPVLFVLSVAWRTSHAMPSTNACARGSKYQVKLFHQIRKVYRLLLKCRSGGANKHRNYGC